MSTSQFYALQTILPTQVIVPASLIAVHISTSRYQSTVIHSLYEVLHRIQTKGSNECVFVVTIYMLVKVAVRPLLGQTLRLNED